MENQPSVLYEIDGDDHRISSDPKAHECEDQEAPASFTPARSKPPSRYVRFVLSVASIGAFLIQKGIVDTNARNNLFSTAEIH
jgi:hypothetical protein